MIKNGLKEGLVIGKVLKILEKELKSDFELKRTGGLMVAENKKDVTFLKRKISAEKKLPDFFPGDIIKVGVKITEGKRVTSSSLPDFDFN